METAGPILLRMSRRKFFGLTFGRNRSRSAIDANIMALAYSRFYFF